MKNIGLILWFLCVMSGCDAQVADKLSPEVFKKQIQNETSDFRIIDLRTDDEVAEGMVPGAEQLDFYNEDFEEMLEELDKNITYYIYCRSGGRSGKTLTKMSEMGFQKVYDLEGGMNAWNAAGFETK